MKQRGFTLIEVLVALVLVSIMALLAWRGVDSMSRASEQTKDYEQSTQRLGITLAQWTADLDALVDTGIVKALDFDGQSLRLTRRASQPSDGVVVVVWVIRLGKLERYASPAVTKKIHLQTSWDNAVRWARTPLPEDATRVASLIPVSHWQLFYFRNDAWTNPQSSGQSNEGTSANPPVNPPPLNGGREALPDGVRLILDMPASEAASGLTGKITRDWVHPTLGATR